MRRIRTVLLIIADIFLVNMAHLLAINITFPDNFTHITTIYQHDFMVVSLVYIIAFLAAKMYHSLWDQTGTDEFLLGVSGGTVAGIVVVIYTRFIGATIPINVCVLGTVFSIVFVLGLRILYRVYRRALLYMPYKYSADQRRVMIVGAGSAGTMIINEMFSKRELKYNPVVLIDDDRYKRGKRISGVKIEGNRYDIPHIAKEKEIDLIVIAIPTLDTKNKNEIIEICTKARCKIQIIPGIYEILTGEASVSRIKDVELEDLLGREQVSLDGECIKNYINNNNIIVTGGGGSIGSELCRQIAIYNPKSLIIFDIYENNAYDIQNELKYKYPKLHIETLIGSIRDEKRLEEVFSKYDIDVVFHAAAHKHVPLMEDSPKEAIKNNVFGTYKLSKVADKYNVKKFVLISTDKAVNPTNIMGATKRLCEMIIQAMNNESETDFVAVRFGNVLGSNGSVIPLFKKQIANGGPVTVTHKNITRFFMLIPEAAQLVLQAGALAKGGEVFVLDMGKPVKIYDLACDLIRLSGLEPNKDIKIEVTGLRPGEKLYEELLMSEEGLTDTTHNKIYIGKPTFTSYNKLKDKLEQLESLLEENDNDVIKNKMAEIVPTYKRPVQDEVAVE
ncbi:MULTISPECIES: polysaccharide biosynthesis protein [Clostridium]|uniref:polysaccharide biosynthesis protein n=1 Tax=Clostridium TaxID=1485 RepID=UPI000C068B72|nr:MULTISPECIES: nucleoside-diphosphate sugar epimerase/dehydratase [Clostridium]MBS4958425.1 polysaccharide biosynthesis protein [Clostridium sp.]MBS5308223.1 polysaccharide biosynthesis protein [Clostridium sp.]MDU2156814.1 nucleoside-diphosphate sugar epimerase/dehydratase [Clostridium sp.]MDU3349055.1 nucleoside-diphosphate sugar epimerase/dehydratase [Clostridium sp.]MDU3408582.1 nucleoside-diphosphate sugar epimerase/dehydratase [Clostridium sp.]